MKALAAQLRDVTARCDEKGHPIDLFRVLEPEYLRAAADVSARAGAAGADPEALHAGRRQRLRRGPPRRLRQGPRPQLLRHLRPGVHEPRSVGRSRPGVQGRISRSLRPVGAARRACRSSTPSARSIRSTRRRAGRTRIDDGLPETLEEWIPHDGLIHFKIKLNGDNLEPTSSASCASIGSSIAAQAARGVTTGSTRSTSTSAARTSATCSSSCAALREATPAGFDRIQYIEQPTARDLGRTAPTSCTRPRELRPVVIDESLIDLEACCSRARWATPAWR